MGLIINPYRFGAAGQTFSDDFNRANENLDASANWTEYQGARFSVVSNQCSHTSGSPDSRAKWNTDTNTADQYAEIDVVTAGVGVVLRYLPNTNWYEFYVAGDGNCYVSRDGITVIGIVAFATGGRLRAEVEGTTLSVYRNGSFLNDYTNSSLTGYGGAGDLKVGIVASGNATLDNFAGGDL